MRSFSYSAASRAWRALYPRDTRGAVLVMTAVMLVGLTALSAFVVDYGILWISRRQIQNAADAAAMAAAMSLAFNAPGDFDRARIQAMAVAQQNLVWGDPPTMESTDVTFAACPVGSVGSGTCVKVEAFRNQARGSAVPTIFARLVNVDFQGVAATATAQVLHGDATDCVKPIGIPDKWTELNPTAKVWDPFDTFSLTPPPGDLYIPPAGPGANGTGYSRGSTALAPGDFGRSMTFSPLTFPLLPGQKMGNQLFMPVRTSLLGGGAAAFQQNFDSCSAMEVHPGDILEIEQSPVATQTTAAADTLIGKDPGASWDPSLYGGRGGVRGGCMASGDCVVSPRIIAIPAFNPADWDASPPGRSWVIVTRLVGFFLQSASPGGFLNGYLMVYPVIPRSTMTADPQSSFVVSVSLVR
ncbi:MAG: pilus assembly protein TadG-related protein [Vicinamibacterales bacterium]